MKTSEIASGCSVALFIGVVGPPAVILAGLLIAGRIVHARTMRQHKEILASVETQARPLLDAIHTYEDEHGAPPPSLERLVPEYIEVLPETKRPHVYAYRAFTPTSDEESWELRVTCHDGLMTEDWFIYRPTLTYPAYVDGAAC